MDEALKPLRVAEVADRLNVSGSTIRRMIDHGDLEIIHVGPKLVRVPATEVERVLSATERRGPGTQETEE